MKLCLRIRFVYVAYKKKIKYGRLSFISQATLLTIHVNIKSAIMLYLTFKKGRMQCLEKLGILKKDTHTPT